MVPAVVLGTAAFSPVHAAAAGPASFTCSGTLAQPGSVPSATYLRFTVPAGTACLISSPVTALTPVTIGADAALLLLGGSLTVNGPLHVGPRAAFGDAGNTAPIDIRGPVSVADGAAFLIGSETPGGPILSHIYGPVRAHNPGTVQIHNTDVYGPVRLVGGGQENAIVAAFAPGFPSNFNDLEDNNIFGPVSMTGYHGIWAGIIRDHIFGPLTFSNNVQSVIDEWDIGSNVIYGPATCSDNTPAPNLGHSAGQPSVVYGPTRGDQAATCTGV